LPALKGGEVFVVFRLVGHSKLGKPVHIEGRKLAFWQGTSIFLPSVLVLVAAGKEKLV